MSPLRAVAATVMAVLAGLLVSVGAIAWWASTTVVSTSGFVSAVGPLSQQTAVKAELTSTISSRVITSVKTAVDNAPFPVNQLGGLVDQLREPVTKGVRAVVDSDTAETVWTSTLTTLHDQTVADLRGDSSGVDVGDGTATIDLNDVRQPILDSVEVPDAFKSLAADIDLGTITLTTGVSSGSLELGVKLADSWLPILLVGALLVALTAVVARRAGRGLVLAGVAIIAFSAAGYWLVASGLGASNAPDPLSRALDQAISGALVPNLRHGATLAVISGALVVLAGVVVSALGRRRPAPEAPAPV